MGNFNEIVSDSGADGVVARAWRPAGARRL